MAICDTCRPGEYRGLPIALVSQCKSRTTGCSLLAHCMALPAVEQQVAGRGFSQFDVCTRPNAKQECLE